MYVDLDRARHPVEICGAWFAAIEIYENLCTLWPIMESMAAPYSMALKTGFADEAGSPAPDESVTNCLQAVEDYRGQHISKWEAISKIATTIQSTTASTDNEQQTTAGDTYLAMLDKHNSLLSKASNRGHLEHQQDNEEEGYEEDINPMAKSKHSLSWSSSPESKWCKFDETLYAWKV
jgi:hypothetical protein